MSVPAVREKTGHPTAGVVLGVIGILIALFFCLLAGLPAGILALFLGLAGMALGLAAKKKSSRGTGAVVTGVAAMVLAVWMTLTSFNLVTAIQKNARQAGAPQLERYASEPLRGVFSIVMHAAEDGVDPERFLEELVFMTDYANGRIPAGTTLAPAATAAP